MSLTTPAQMPAENAIGKNRIPESRKPACAGFHALHHDTFVHTSMSRAAKETLIS
jgi:hypothetical protein